MQMPVPPLSSPQPAAAAASAARQAHPASSASDSVASSAGGQFTQVGPHKRPSRAKRVAGSASVNSAPAQSAAPVLATPSNKRKTAAANLHTPTLTPEQRVAASASSKSPGMEYMSPSGSVWADESDEEENQAAAAAGGGAARPIPSLTVAKSSLSALPSPHKSVAAPSAAAGTPMRFTKLQRKDPNHATAAAASSSSSAITSAQRSLSMTSVPSRPLSHTAAAASNAPVRGSSQTDQATMSNDH